MYAITQNAKIKFPVAFGNWSLRRLFSGTYLIWKTGNSGWEIKWLAPFRLGSFKKYGL